eukprot:gene14934-17572_t
MAGLASLLWAKERRRAGAKRRASPRAAAQPRGGGGLVPMCFCAGVLAYIARSAPSIALPYITQETPMTHAERAAFLSAFFYGYLPANLCAGVAIRQFGGGRVLFAA